MKVRIELTVEVDPAEWAEEYDIHQRGVRVDVQQYVRCLVDGSADGMLVLS